MHLEEFNVKLNECLIFFYKLRSVFCRQHPFVFESYKTNKFGSVLKVSDSYATLEQRVGESSTLQERLETNLTNVKKLLEMTNTDIQELETRIAHLETDVHNIQQQQEEHTEDIRYVKKQQHVHTEGICKVQEEQKTHGEEIRNIQQQQKVHLKGIASLERRQDETKQVVDSLKMMTTQQQGTKPLEKGRLYLLYRHQKMSLREYKLFSPVIRPYFHPSFSTNRWSHKGTCF